MLKFFNDFAELHITTLKNKNLSTSVRVIRIFYISNITSERERHYTKSTVFPMSTAYI